MIKAKRVYVPKEKDDGQRISVGRIWLRGVKGKRREGDEGS
jgi:uncharacterized protein YeaO (DUF488 family)